MARVFRAPEFDVKLPANTVDEAIRVAGRTADGVASFITLVTGVGIPVIRPAKIMETTDGKTERDFMQFFDDIPTGQASRDVVDPHQLIEAIDKFGRIADKKVQDRVARAVRWYRQGTIHIDPFDRFSSYWIGMEALNKALQDSLKPKDTYSVNLDEDSKSRDAETMSGAKEFIIRYFDGTGKLFKELRDYRVKIMHSTTNLQGLSSGVASLTPRLGDILTSTIYYLCAIPSPWKTNTTIISNALPLRAALEAKVLSDKAEDAYPEDSKLPHFEATHQLDQVRSGSEKRTEATVTSRFTVKMGPKAKISASALRLYGEGQGTLKVNSTSVESGQRPRVEEERKKTSLQS